MKRTFLKVLLAAIALLLCGTALAQEDIQTVELELFSRGGLPEVYPVMFMAEDDFDSYLYEQLMLQSASINLRSYELTVDEFKIRLENLINNDPKLFFVDNAFQVATNTSGILTRLIPSYLYTGEDFQNRMAAFEASIREIADFARGASTDAGRLLLLNDYFCVNFDYDKTLSVFGPDQLLTGGTGVCQAYMLAYAAVLDELGIENSHATSHSMRHTWNVVELDGYWYHIDVTWNDSGYPLGACHDLFLLSDAAMEATNHYDWTSAAACFDTRYDNFFWRGVETPLGAMGNHVYYLDPSVVSGMRTIRRTDMTTGETSSVHSFSIHSSKGDYSYLPGWDPVSAGAGRVFYAARGKLHSVAPDGTDTAFIYTSGDDAMQIWSCWLQGDTLYLLVGKTPADSASIVTCDANQLIALSISPALASLAPGETLQLQAAFPEGMPAPTALSWECAGTAASVNANGLVRAVSPGVALVNVSCREGAEALAAVVVDGAGVLRLPAGAKEIKSEAFIGTAAEMITLPEGLLSIGNRAFADSEKLQLVQLPDSVESIAANAFENSDQVVFICSSDSYAYGYAREAGLSCIIAE